MLTDQLERRLIREEIERQRHFAPLFSFKRVAEKTAAFFGRTRHEGTLTEPRTATR